MKKIFIVGVMLLLYLASNAQNTIKGKITDQENEPLTGASIYIPELNKGTVTDVNGNYEIQNIPNGEIKLQYSFVGFATQIKSFNVNNENIEANISMKQTPVEAEEIVVTAGYNSSQHENAIKIDLLKSKKIAASGSPTLIETFANIPGVDMISKGTGVAKPVIRGLSMTNILMLNNGVKMENFQFSENHPFIIDEFGIDRIEIIKGPASLLYGSDAIGGVINIIKEKPAPTGKIIGDFNMQYHSNTEGFVNNLGIKGSSENFFWGLRAGIKSHADYKNGNGDYVPNTRFNEKSFKATLGLNKSFGLFRLYYDYNRPKLGMCVGDVVPLISENGRENKLWYQDLTSHIISTRNAIFLNDYKIELNASYQMNNRRLQTDESKPAFEMVDMQLNTFSYEIKTHFPSSGNSEYIIGLHGAKKTNRNDEAPNHVLPDADVNDFSVFGLAQHVFFKKLKAQAGIRYDFRSISTEEETNTEAVDKDYGNISGSVGATYRLNEDFLLRANIASAYRTPNIAELTQNGMHGTRYEQGNPALKSQRSYEADFSAHFHSKLVMVDVALFYNRINNYIFIAPTNNTTTGGSTIYQYAQTNSKIYGSELVVNILPLKWLHLKTTYAYLLGKQDDGNYLPFIPQNKLRFEINIQKREISFLKNPFFRIGGLYAAKQDKPAMFETETDSYFLLNAGIGTDIKWASQMLSLSVQANNLLNKTYIDHLSTLKEIGYQNIGRNISINLTIPFGIK